MSELSKRRLKMWIRMLGVTRSAESSLREFLRVKHGTTLPRFDVMAALYRRRDGVTMSELSRMLLSVNLPLTELFCRILYLDSRLMECDTDFSPPYKGRFFLVSNR